jgi:peptide/nickel transport system substrate-binding protein
VALALLAWVTIAACGGGSATTSGGKTYVAGGTVTFRSNGDFRSFDIQTTTDGLTQWVLSNAYSTLLYQDNQGKIHDYMAKSWKFTPTSATFTLKQGITCADGTPVTPTVVKDSLQRMITSKNQYDALLWGPGPYSVTADDANNIVTFNTQSPFPDLQ